jgi:hypothetical protein
MFDDHTQEAGACAGASWGGSTMWGFDKEYLSPEQRLHFCPCMYSGFERKSIRRLINQNQIKFRRTKMGAYNPRVSGRETQEDQYTSAIERRTAQIPSTVYLGLAIGSMAASAILKIMKKDDWALFVGQWAAPILIIGNYNKIVKHLGGGSREWAA